MRLLIFLISVILLTGCVSSNKLYQRGQYDGAIRKSVKKIRGNADNPKEINVLEKSFLAANEANQSRIKYLKTEGKPEMWNEVFTNYLLLKNRQELVRTVLPLKNGNRTIDFPVIDYDREIVDAKKNAAEYFYVHAKKLLSSNDRFKARDAYFELKKVKEYYENYQDVDKYLEQARSAGITSVLLQFENNTYIKLPQEFGIQLLDFNISQLNSEWVNYFNKPTNINYDNIVKNNLKIINISPEKQIEKESRQTKTIQDGWEYKLDQYNNTIKDSLGNPVKIPRMVNISCKVLEVLQQKAAHLDGVIEYYDKNNLFTSKQLASDFFFENRIVNANGDLRALDTETAKLVGKPPVPFPNDIQMIMGATDIFKKVMIDILNDNKYLIK
ncbi:MAG: hypothetical protein COX07_04265 [Bacteroidetes bacterium CG23_combo_of_CG06-09_8_20_14_all_32_9]|nr:MAG: hypothetical protein COX07_04265 [Bacteroidetes bacterium CG23_combo_of_CG06-09_8_20_14_all_32_9]